MIINFFCVFLFFFLGLECSKAYAQETPAAGHGALRIDPDAKPGPHVLFWLESSSKRVYPSSPAGDNQTLELLTARNRSISFQACLKNNRTEPVNVICSVTAPANLPVEIRRVGYVPMNHHTTADVPEQLEGFQYVPGFVPDPLFPEQKASVPPWENQSFWITVRVPANIEPGTKELTVHFSFHDGTKHADLKAKIDVRPLVLQPRKEFPITHWWRAESIYGYYKTEPFDERWWELTRAYLTDLVQHGNNMILVPLYSVRSELLAEPPQLLKITCPAPGKYEFDWTLTSRFLKMARECGAEYFEWPHLWIYWGVEHPMPIYQTKDGKMEILWPMEISGFSDTYVNFLRQYLPALHEFLVKENALGQSYFHLSDEPSPGQHYENYKRARGILKEIAPWMKVMDALSSLEYGKSGITDYPIPVISAANAYIDEKIPHWVYFCCGPRGDYLNRFMDTPLPWIRMSGWLFYRLKAQGFLHWGYNGYHAIDHDLIIDPFVEQCSNLWPMIPHGDPFVVYPGPNGPLDSIRWEVFWESMQDFAMLQSAGISPDDPLLDPIKDYKDFPKNEQWLQDATRQLLNR